MSNYLTQEMLQSAQLDAIRYHQLRQEIIQHYRQIQREDEDKKDADIFYANRVTDRKSLPLYLDKPPFLSAMRDLFSIAKFEVNPQTDFFNTVDTLEGRVALYQVNDIGMIARDDRHCEGQVCRIYPLYKYGEGKRSIISPKGLKVYVGYYDLITRNIKFQGLPVHDIHIVKECEELYQCAVVPPKWEEVGHLFGLKGPQTAEDEKLWTADFSSIKKLPIEPKGFSGIDVAPAAFYCIEGHSTYPSYSSSRALVNNARFLSLYPRMNDAIKEIKLIFDEISANYRMMHGIDKIEPFIDKLSRIQEDIIKLDNEASEEEYFLDPILKTKKLCGRRISQNLPNEYLSPVVEDKKMPAKSPPISAHKKMPAKSPPISAQGTKTNKKQSVARKKRRQPVEEILSDDD